MFNQSFKLALELSCCCLLLSKNMLEARLEQLQHGSLAFSLISKKPVMLAIPDINYIKLQL